MSDAAGLDEAFQFIVRRFVETGCAPHYTELARARRASPEEGRQVLHAVMKAFFPGWLYPETDYIASFPPFNNLSTQYRISVGGHQKWFAQCGFEALAMTWLFPGQAVRIDAPCLDCGDPIRIEMRDGQLLTVEPTTVIGHLNHPFPTRPETRAPS
jgi:hypothetical protein